VWLNARYRNHTRGDAVTPVVSVHIEGVDALSVGLSLRALARNQKTPHGKREIYERVGAQMVSAARAAMSGGAR
jgi:hypothetical protein